MMNLLPLRRLAVSLDGRRIPLNREERAEMIGDIPYWGANGVVDYVDRPVFNERLVLLGEDGAPFFESGKDVAFLIDGPVWVNNHIHVLRPNSGVEPRFLTYALNSVDFAAYITGSTRDKLTQDDMWSITVPVAPHSVQVAIADYLDAETARIDALIEKKRRMVELLEERLSVLTDDVIWSDDPWTSPLMYRTDPSRPIMYGIVLPGPDVPDGVPIVKGGDVAAGRLSPELLNRTTREIEAPFARARLATDDLVFAIRGGIGDVDIVPSELAGANITQDVARVAPARGVSPLWLRFVLRAPTVRRQCEARTTGATIKGLNIWELKRIRIPMSDSARQDRDLAVLIAAEARTERQMSLLSRQIDLLVEHRQALITAAVTGQLEVPGVAA